MYYSDKEYNFLKFERSKNTVKKYDAILENKQTKKKVRVPFGQKGYMHYKDNTGLKIYSNLDHNDPERRKAYRARHGANDYQKKKYSPAYFSYFYLW